MMPEFSRCFARSSSTCFKTPVFASTLCISLQCLGCPLHHASLSRANPLSTIGHQDASGFSKFTWETTLPQLKNLDHSDASSFSLLRVVLQQRMALRHTYAHQPDPQYAFTEHESPVYTNAAMLPSTSCSSHLSLASRRVPLIFYHVTTCKPPQ